MDVYASFAQFLARQLGLPAEEEEVVLYGLEVTANVMAGTVALMLVGWLLEAFWPTAVAALAAMSLRTWAGGAHASSSRNCTLITAVVLGGLGWLAARIAPVLLDGGLFVALAGGLAAALAAVARWAPADTPNRPLTDPAHRRALRRMALGTVLAWGGILGALAAGVPVLPAGGVRPLILAGTLGLAWQSLSITPVGYRFVAVWDALLNRLTGMRLVP